MSQLVAVQESGKSLALPGEVRLVGGAPFIAYGESVNPQHIVGQILKFSKGEYLAGENAELIPVGTKLVVSVDELAIGWVRWQGGKPTEHRMVRVADNQVPAKRADLGDLDQSVWEKDEVSGEPRDPWSFENYLPMSSEEGELFTFATSSRGGIGAVGKLSTFYGRRLHQHPGELPVIELGVGTYQHSNKAYGRIKFPEFNVVGWTSKSVFNRALAAAGLIDADAVDGLVSVEAKPADAELADSIPF
jgi:hypothetical protein